MARFLFLPGMFFASILLLCASPTNAVAQWVWARGAGGASYDYAYAVTTDGAGNVYVAGTFSSASITFGSTTLTNAASGSPDVYIVKYDAAGNVKWAKRAGGSGDDEATSIKADAFGNIYVTGSYASSAITFGSTTLTNTGSANVFLVKYDTSGTAIWARTGQGSGYNYANSVTTDASGNVYITGEFRSTTFTLGTTSVTNADAIGNTGDVFLAKYDASGNVLWVRTGAGTSDDYGIAVAVDNTGNPYITGYFDSGDMLFGTNHLYNISSGNQDVFLVKYTPTGSVVWAKMAACSSTTLVSGLAIDASGGVYISGNNTTSITFGSSTLTGGSFLAKYDASGSVVWGQQVGNSSGYTQGLAADAAGGIYMTGGFSTSAVTFGTSTVHNDTSQATLDVYLVKYDGSGNALWAKGAGGGIIDYAKAVTVDGANNVFVAGYTNSHAMHFDNDSVLTHGYYDMFVGKFNGNGLDVPGIPVSVGRDWTVYPNPSNGKVTISSIGYIDRVSVYNCTGILVNEVSASSTEKSMQIDLGNLANGLYYILAENSNGRGVIPLIIKR